MNSKPMLRRHPIAAALLLAALVAGCSGDDASMYAQNAQQSAGRPYAQPVVERGAPGAGYAQAGGYAAQSVGNGAGYGNSAGYRDSAEYGNSAGYGNAAGNGGNGGADKLDELMAWERQDAGVRPTRELHSGAMHGPTPNQIPGGQVITTKGLVPLLQQGVPVHVFDVLGVAQTLPNAIPAEFAAAPGSFDDRTQEQLAKMLEQVTRGNTSAPLVFYCQGPQCWMSYNAALRSIALGYRNVLWYRGGMEAWNNAGLHFAARRG